MEKQEAINKLEETVGAYLLSGRADDTTCGEWREILETLKQEPKFIIHSDGAIEQIPIREHGKWIGIVDGIEYTWATCNKCKGRTSMAYKYYNFCPNCGAEMEGSK